ncbi:MAG: NfeD family protein [Massilibacteroides sp.]|nr:NfeD family protein [Massilibacteroides sp.]MDD3061559.1 NfeD family protein [Massilibacteroides sp.]MDD4114557.1 NfeD family protein [Massilibacteroides sp.]MDD4659151.1 NfeD family protein [Massilibacteroides sp.]
MLFNTLIIAFLIIVAILLLLLEIFLLPGITVAGVGGFVFAVGGIIYAYTVGQTIGNITLISSVLTFGIAFFWLLRSKSFNRVALNTNIDSRLTSSRELGIETGDEGITLSRLAPIGKALIKGITVEAKSTGEFINEETPIKVVRVDGYNVLVEPIENKNININN